MLSHSSIPHHKKKGQGQDFDQRAINQPSTSVPYNLGNSTNSFLGPLADPRPNLVAPWQSVLFITIRYAAQRSVEEPTTSCALLLRHTRHLFSALSRLLCTYPSIGSAAPAISCIYHVRRRMHSWVLAYSVYVCSLAKSRGGAGRSMVHPHEAALWTPPVVHAHTKYSLLCIARCSLLIFFTT